jgi:hypothetical protein
MSLLSIIRNAARQYHARREWARTERIIASLPPEIRKDIGWPNPRRQ